MSSDNEMKKNLSVCLIVKNEEQYLFNCLSSVKDIADEIILVDTGSTDSSIEIAGKFTAKVYNFEWVNDFSAARNYAISKAEGEWILYLDADERISPESLKELSEIAKTESKTGYFCTVKSIDNENNRDNSMRYIRLFRNLPSIAFQGKVHEQISGSLLNNGYALKNSDILILHLGYDISSEDKKAKAERNLTLLLAEYADSKTGYYAFQLASTYAILGEDEKSHLYYKVAVGSKDLSVPLKAEAYTNIALYWHKLFNPALALEFAQQSLSLNRNQPFTLFLISKIYFQAGEKLKAEEFCRKALTTNRNVIKESSKAELQVYLEEEEILYYGINLALLYGTKANYAFYAEELKKLLNSKEGKKGDNFVTCITKLLSKQKVTGEEANELISLLNKYSAEFIFSVIDSSVASFSPEFFMELSKKFENDLNVIKIRAKYYAGNNQIDKALDFLEENLKIIEKDPAALLHLISYYLSAGKNSEGKKWLAYMGKQFADMPKIKAIVENLSQKI